MMAATALTPMSVMDGPVDTDVYNRTMQKLLRPIAWVVLPGGIRCPVVPDEVGRAAMILMLKLCTSDDNHNASYLCCCYGHCFPDRTTWLPSQASGRRLGMLPSQAPGQRLGMMARDPKSRTVN